MSLTYAFNKGQNVLYNSEVHTIFRYRGTSSPQYLLRKISDGSSVDNVDESALTTATCENVINTMWPNFTYTGDNGAASRWVLNNLLKNMYQCNEQSTWGPNADSTVYTYTMGSMSWTKNKS
jgi:hypothetical protein